MPTSWRDRLLSPKVTDALGWMTLIVVILVAIVSVAYFPNIFSRTNEVRDGNLLASCRASYSAQVTNRRTLFDLARARRDDALSHVDLLTNEITEEAIFGRDEARIAELRALLPDARAAVIEGNARVREATLDLHEANSTYQEQVALSRIDPDTFLQECKEQNP